MDGSETFLFGTQSINEAGHLTVGGCDTVELAKEFGTPLYVLDEQYIRDTCRAYRNEFGSRLERVEVAYAGKALLCTAMCRIMQQEGMALDTASTGELFTAVSAGFPLNKVKLHGNFKTDELLGKALEYQVGRIVADSITELQRLSRIAVEMGKEADILIRVGPGIKTQTHSYIQTGQADSKFGLSIASGAAMEGIKLALELPNINLHGLHCHIGSQLFGLDSFGRAVDMMMEFVAQVRAETGWESDELDMGGGLGIAYTPEDAAPTVAELAEIMPGDHPGCEAAQPEAAEADSGAGAFHRGAGRNHAVHCRPGEDDSRSPHIRLRGRRAFRQPTPGPVRGGVHRCHREQGEPAGDHGGQGCGSPLRDGHAHPRHHAAAGRGGRHHGRLLHGGVQLRHGVQLQPFPSARNGSCKRWPG